MSNICSVVGLLETLADLMVRMNKSCVTAESCTGGGISQAITAIAGSSKWFDRGFVTYSNQAKKEMLEVNEKTLQECGAVSQETAKEMAEGAFKKSQADFSVAVTGIAGPDGGTKEKPVGTVWIAWAGGFLKTKATCFHFKGDRAEVREQTILTALQGLLERVRESAQDRKEGGRYFFALWPDEKTADKLYQTAQQFVDPDKGQLTPPPHLHLTLQYLGRITGHFKERAMAAANQINLPTLRLTVDGINDWPNVRVRYLSLSESPPGLQALVKLLNQQLLMEGCKSDSRPFVPHITLVRQSKHDLLSQRIDSTQWDVNQFHLVCANNQAEKKYQIIKTFPLS